MDFLTSRFPMSMGVRSGLPEQQRIEKIVASETPIMARFDPYSQNGGTIMAVAGEDFVVIAGDTRLSEGYSIHTRDCPKTKNLTSKTVIATGGSHNDVLTLHKELDYKLSTYALNLQKEMSCTAIAQNLATMLYYKRFFPYYTYNIIGGIDENGRGAVYSYDPVGSYEREIYRAAGSGTSLLQPLLDSELGQKNKSNKSNAPLSLEAVINVVKDAFAGVAERDIMTGDAVEIKIITKDGIRIEMFPLRRD